MLRTKRRVKKDVRSYVEVRMILFACGIVVVSALAIPAIIRAADFNGDNIDDAWEAQYGITTNAYSSTNLVGWWQMEPNSTNAVVDSSPNQLTGTLTNFPGTPFGTGLFSNALYFPATAQVNFPANAAFDTATNQFTFSAWFQSTNNLSQPASIATWTDAQTNSWNVSADGTGAAGVTFSDGLGNTQTIAPMTGAIQLYDGSWHQVAVTYDTNQLATVYVDGQSQASGTITNWAPTTTAAFSLGVPDDTSSNQPYALDDTRLYNRAMGADEINELPVTYTDLNGTGLTVLDDYLEGLNPLATNVVVTSDFASSGLASYYGTNLPVLTKTSGDAQVVAAGTFGSDGLTVHITDGSGTTLVGAPVTFALQTGSDGGISQTSGGSTVVSISLATDADGNATVYYQADADVIRNNKIVATAVTEAGNVTACFKEHCGIQDGLASWLYADTGVTADGSENVSQWLDQSPNTNSATQATTGIQPQLVASSLQGHSVIHFDGSSQYLSLPTCIADDFTMIVVFRSTLGSGSGPDWYAAGGIVDAETSGVVNDFGMSLDPDGDVLTGVGNPDTTQSSKVGGYNDGRAHIATFTRNESTGWFGQFVDSAYQGGQNNGNTSSLTDPPQITIGATQTLANYFGGDVAEVLLYSRKLSGIERGEVEGFLADKYGIYSSDATWPTAYGSDVQAQIAANNWNQAQADAYITFAASPPVPASGLLLWLTANTGVTADGDGNVQQWFDQSPSGHIVSQSDLIAPPVLQNDASGNPCLTFNGSQALVSSDYLPANTDLTIIAVETDQQPDNFSMILTLGGFPSLNEGQTRSLCDYYGSQEFDLYYAGAGGGLTGQAGEEVVASVTFQRSSGTAQFYMRGDANGSGYAGSNDLSSGFFIGDSADMRLPFNGSIYSVLVYNRVLTNSERSAAEGYLADQYGAYSSSATWPYAYGGDIQELIFENEWNKAATDAYVASLGDAVRPAIASPTGGNFASSQTVTVTSATSDATIYYTTDGSTPTTGSSSMANGGTLTVSATSEYRFLASDGSAPDSSITTDVYRIGDSGNLAAGDSFTMIRKPDGTVWTWGDNGRGQQGDNQYNNPAGVPQQVPSLSGVSAIAAAGDHALAVTSDGSVWAWGADDQAEGGDGGGSDQLVPTQISGLSNITSVYAAQPRGFAVDSDGNLFGWGDNSSGQLGDGTTNNQGTPEALTAVSNVLKVAASPNFTLVLESDGSVWATGNNDNGQLGDGTQNSETSFQQISTLSNVVDIAVGWEHALALCSDGSVWSWGYGSDGELGHGGYSGMLVPSRITGIPPAVAVFAVDSKSFVLLADGTLRCFGVDNEGELGFGVGINASQPTPTQPAGVQDVTLLAAGTYHTVICTTKGALYGWGDNTSFRLTQDFTNASFNSPAEVHDPLWQGFTKIVIANTCPVGLKSDGTVWSTGSNNAGSLGDGNYATSERPVQVAGLTGITSIAGGNVAMAIDGSENLWVWGGNWDGQLGIGNYNWLNAPQQVSDVSNVIAAVGGDNHTLIIESDGSVWAAGDDSQGELGDGGSDQQPSFIQVTGVSDALQVAAGSNTSFVLESDGSVWAWGENDVAQLGLGTTGNVASPTQITGLPAMTTISVCGNNGMGIDEDGNVWSWGGMGNSDGTPLEQSGVSGVTAIAAGTYHELAIESDGTLWGLGANFSGQLGDPSYYNATSFTQFPDVAGATAIAANYDTSLVVKQDGTIAGFGDCNNGQLAGNLGLYDDAPKRQFGIGMFESAPTVAITSPSGGASATEGTALNFQASASASTGSIAKVDYYLNGVKLGTSTTSGTWDFSWTPTTYGDLTFEAIAVDTAGVATISSPVTVSVAFGSGGGTPAPSAPTGVTVTAGPPGTVYIGWTNGSGATSILIQEQNTDGSWTTVDTITDPSTTTDTITGLTPDQDYNFRVVESNDTGTSTGSGSFSASSPNPPVLTKQGDEQVVAASSFAANPLIVQVDDSTGRALPGVPIAFAIALGSDGGLSLTSGGSVSGTQNVSTNALGQATVYYQAGDDALQNNSITASAASGSGNITTTFTERCGESNGLAIWFKADSGVTQDGSGNVSGWADQTGNYTVAQSSSGNQPTYIASDINGGPALRFNGSQWLSSTAATTGLNAGMTIITVAMTTSPGSLQNSVALGNASWYQSRNVGYYGGAQLLDITADHSSGGAAPSAGVFVSDAITLDSSGANVAYYRNGTETATGTLGGVDDVSPGLMIGNRAEGLAAPWRGDIAEALVFDHQLSPTDLATVDEYLGDKYGYYSPNATWPDAYSGDVQALIASNQWNEPQAAAYAAFLATSPAIPAYGVVAWFKADAGVTSDGSGDVTAWADQGPDSYVADQSNSGLQPTIVSNAYNGKPAVRFDGSSQYLQIPSLHDDYSAGLSIFAVYNPTSNGSWARVLDFGNGPAADNIIVARDSTGPNFFVQALQGGSNAFDIITSDLATSQLQEYSVVDDPASQAYVYKNGAVSASTAGGSPNSVTRTSNFIGKSNWADSLFQGDICELIIYNRPLTSGEREQVEGYLADRYGLYSPSSTWPSAYSSDIQTLITSNQWSKAQADAYVTFAASSPVPASGLSLWLKADAGVTADGSGNVSAWADQSPNGNNAGPSSGSQVTIISSGTGGKPMLHFNGSNYLAIPDAASLRPNYITVLAVAQENSTATYQTLISRAYRNSSGWGYPYVSWDMCLFGVNGGNYLRSAVSTGGNLTENDAGNSYDISQPHIFGWQYDGTNQMVFLEGVETASTPTSGVLDYGGGIANICIGSRSDASPGETLNADVSEILVYDHVLSSDDEAQAEGYLADKYGLNDPDATWPMAYSSDVQAEIARNHWNKADADAYVALQSSNPGMLTTGLKLWLKADAGVNQDGSGNVNSWTDQTGNYTVGQSGSVRPTYIASDVNGKPALHFNGGQTLYNSSNMGSGVNADMTMIAVCSSYNPGAQQYTIYLGNTGGYGNRGLGYYASRQLFDLSNGNYSLGAGTPPPNIFTTEEWTLASNLSDVTFYRNGVVSGTASMGSVQNVTPGITIGGYNGYGTPWQGDIAEVLVYDHQLTPDETAELYGYLSDKYGFYNENASWPLAYSSDVQAEITRNQWTKSQADNYVALQSANPDMVTGGMLLWLKADAGITADGSGNVSSWADQSGNYNLTQGTTGNDPTLITSDLNGKPALRFNGSQWLHDPNSIGAGANGDITMIMVASTSSQGSQQYGLWLGATGTGYNRGLGYYNWSQIFDTYNIWIGGSGVPAANDFVVEASTLSADRSTMTLYQNGTQTGSNGSVSGIQNIQAGVSVGTLYGAGYNWQGDIAEVLVYDHQLSSDDLQTVGIYLADKYGLYNADATWPLAYSSDVQALITANQWNKSQADAYVTFLGELADFATDNPLMVTNGLTMWVKADSGVTADGSNKVSQWADQTPYANNGNQLSVGNQPTFVSARSDLNGKPVIRFDGGSSFLDVTDNASLKPANAVTVIAIAQTNNLGTYQDIVSHSLSYNWYGEERWPLYSYDLGLVPNNVERGYIGFGPPDNGDPSAGVDLGGSTARATTMAISTLVYDGTNVNGAGASLDIYNGGILQATAPLSNPILYDTNAHDLVIGAAEPNWGWGSPVYTDYFSGDIAEIFVYNRALTTAEQQQMEVYLADKYGVYHPDATWPSAYSTDVQALITYNGWNKAQADAYVAFAAAETTVPASGLTVWLKADAGVTADGSNKVSQWADQTLYANNANQSSSGNQPTWISSRSDLNNEPVVRFDGSSSFLDVTDNPSIKPSTAVTVIAVAQTNSSGQQDLVSHGMSYNWYSEQRWPLYSYDLGILSNNVERGYIGFGPPNSGDPSAGADLAGATALPHQMAISSMTYDGAHLNIYDAGIAQGSVALSNPIAYDGTTPHDLIVGAYSTYYGITNYFNGDMAEVLVYNRALTPTERENVEGYLADKYTVFAPNATWPSAYGDEVQELITANEWTKAQADAYVAFAASETAFPSSGLSVWLKADAGITADGSNKVSVWADQTPNGNNANQATGANQPTLVTTRTDLNGKPVVRFDGSSSYLDITDNPSIKPTQALTVIAVAQTTSTAVQDLVSHGLTFNYYSEQRWPLYSYDLGIQANNVERGYIGFGLGQGDPNSGADLSGLGSRLDQMTISALVFDGANLQIFDSGSAQGSAPVGAPILYDGTTAHDLIVGAYSTYYGITNFFNGDMAEVLVYNRALTPTERGQAEGYLADKYTVYAPTATWPLAYSTDVQAQIAINEWTKEEADSYVAFQADNSAMMTTGLLLWLKADDGVTADGSNNVSAWADQTGNYTVTQATGGSQPTLVASDINGKAALHFSGAQALSQAVNLGMGLNQDVTIVTVANTTSPTSAEDSIYLGASGQSRGLGYYNSDQYADFSSAVAETGAAAPTSGAFVTEAVTLNKTLQNAVFYRNGVMTGSTPMNSLQTVANGIVVGNRSDGTTPWQGDIAEILVFDHQLTTAEMNQVGGSLGDKYGLYNSNATWMASYTNDVQARIAAYQWSKAQADTYVAAHTGAPSIVETGLAMWLKADAGITHDGSGNVSAWADQTSTYTFSQTGSAQPTFVATDINGKPALHMSGSQFLASTGTLSGINADCTILTVASTSSPASQQYSFYAGSGSGSGFANRAIGYSSSQEFYDTAGSSATTGEAPPANTFVTEAATLDSGLTSVTYYQNGNQTGTGTLGSLVNVSAGIAIGASPVPDTYWQGDIAEVIVYDHKLSASDLQQVDGYLADKYGLFDPNATWMSAYTEAVEVEIFKHQWNKAQADNYVAMQSAHPTMLTNGLTLWLRADAGVTKDGSNNVSAVVDQASSNTLTQSTGGAQPTYVASDLNGNPAFRFNGTQWLANSAAAVTGLNQDMTVITVAMTTAPTAQQYPIYLGANNGTTGINRAVGYLGSDEMFDTAGSCVGGLAPAPSAFAIEVSTLDPGLTDVAFYQDGVSNGTGTLSGVQNLSPGITFGADGAAANGWQGDVAEVLVYDHQLSNVELQQVTLYLASKYGLAANGPAPSISPNGGSFSSTQSVTITTSITGASIHYTLDGTAPTASSPTYSSAISLSNSALVQALAVSPTGIIQSQTASAQFYINDPDSTGLPPAPTGLTVTSTSPTQDSLSWSLSGASTYNQIYIYRSTNGGPYQLIAVLNATDTSFVDNTVTAGNSYTYEVGTVNQSGVGTSAGSASVTPSSNGLLDIVVTTPSGATPLP